MSYDIALGTPGKGFCAGAVRGLIAASQKHKALFINSCHGFDDFNFVWANALNMAEQGIVTHFAMLHTDVSPHQWWLDVLIDELDRYDADLVSAPIAIKNHLGMTSSGIGDHADRWTPLRRFTIRELFDFPETFNAADVGYEGYPLLHNTGCWACDLRKPVFFRTDGNGEALCSFKFPMGVARKEDGTWGVLRESEDWYFSRQLFDLGAKTYITRKVNIMHTGDHEFPNFVPWGDCEHDEETRFKWGQLEPA